MAEQNEQVTPGNTTNIHHPMRDYVTPNQYRLDPHLRAPLDCNVLFEIKHTMLQMLPTFYGHPNKEPYQQLEQFLDICDMMQIPNVSKNTIRLKLFPYSLKRKLDIGCQL